MLSIEADLPGLPVTSMFLFLFRAFVFIWTVDIFALLSNFSGWGPLMYVPFTSARNKSFKGAMPGIMIARLPNGTVGMSLDSQ